MELEESMGWPDWKFISVRKQSRQHTPSLVSVKHWTDLCILLLCLKVYIFYEQTKSILSLTARCHLKVSEMKPRLRPQF